MRKQILQKIIDEKPEACLVKNKYKVIVGMIRRMYPNNYEKIPHEVWEKLVFEIVNADRDWRMLTEGKDKVNKERLRQEYIIKNLC